MSAKKKSTAKKATTKKRAATTKKTATRKSATKKVSSSRTPAKNAPHKKAPGRVDQFRALSERMAEGSEMVPPVLLKGQARREHIRSTLREDHARRIEQQKKGAKDKFNSLSGSLFKFFRGTALLFYRDMVGTDRQMPTVLALGDVHPGNFGIMPDKNGAPIFGVNDFDETIYAPFTWDIKRGAVGFSVAAKEVAGAKKKQRRKIVNSFVKGYLKAMRRYARHATEKSENFRLDNSPKIIRKLFEEAWVDREKWLWDDYLKNCGKGFRADDELQPVSSEIEKFQKAIKDLAKTNDIDVPDRSPELRVKDVCVRHGQGTASLGLPRFYVLLEGPSKNATDDMIIEFKKARTSALEGLTPPSEFNEEKDSKAERIAHGQEVQLAHGDVFYGSVEIDGESFMTRERAPFRDDIDLDELSDKSWKKYSKICGAALAQAHALSDDLGRIDYDVEPSIIEAARPKKLFKADIVRFAEEAMKRMRKDHKMFRHDHEMGAFDQVEKAFR